MATIKNIPDSYTINVPTMTVNGNLNVVGTTTSINSATLDFTDLLVLNSNIGAVTPTIDATIAVYRGTQANTAIRWHEATKTWQITNDGTTFGNVLTAGIPAGNINITGVSLYDTANTTALYTGTVSSGKSGLFVDNTNGTQQELATKSAAVAFSIIFG